MGYSYVGEDTTPSDGIHLLLEVPYTIAGTTIASYQLLGSWADSSNDEAYGSTTLSGWWGSDGQETEPTTTEHTGDDLLWVAWSLAGNDDQTTDSTTQGLFTDDTRTREFDSDQAPKSNYADLATPPAESDLGLSFFYAQGDRKKLSDSLPQYTTWRDHAEGHRITTTRGDKVEVVGGNYKLVVLGRGQGTASLDMSGGIGTDRHEVPGNTVVSWSEIPTDDNAGGWKVVEETEKGCLVERFHGTKQEEFYGDELVSIVGWPDDETGLGASDVDERYQWETLGSSSTTRNYDNTKPKVVDITYSDTFFEYSKAATTATSILLAEEVESYVGCTPEEDTLTDPATPGSRVSNIYERTDATNIEEHHEFDFWKSYRKVTNGGLGIHEYTYGAFTELFVGQFTQCFVGNYNQFFFGLSWTLGLAGRVELFAGAEWQVNIGPLKETSLLSKQEESPLNEMRNLLNLHTCILANRTSALTYDEAALLLLG